MAVSNDGTVLLLYEWSPSYTFTQYPKNLHQPVDEASQTYTFSITEMSVLTWRQWGLIESEHSTRIQIMEVLKFGHSKKKKH